VSMAHQMIEITFKFGEVMLRVGEVP